MEVCCGYAAGVQCYPKYHHVVVAQKTHDNGQVTTALIALESRAWLEDLREEGWVILHDLSNAS